MHASHFLRFPVGRAPSPSLLYSRKAGGVGVGRATGKSASSVVTNPLVAEDDPIPNPSDDAGL